MFPKRSQPAMRCPLLAAMGWIKRVQQYIRIHEKAFIDAHAPALGSGGRPH